MGFARITRTLQLIFFFYVLFAILDSTNRIVIAPLSALWTYSLSVKSDNKTNSSRFPWVDFFLTDFSRGTQSNDIKFSEPSQEVIYWHTSEYVLQHHLGPLNGSATSMREGLFLSKAFAQSMQPNKIVPFFYRASSTFNPEDITITTLVTSNRFKVFAQLVERYQGPISVTVHIKSDSTHTTALLDELHKLYASSPSMATFVDVHLVLDPFDRQLNTWRNIARFFARTDFVMMLDVDFVVCTDFRAAVRASKAVMARLSEGYTALVVPAFEYLKQADGADQKKFPRDKNSLLSLVKAKKIDMFHRSWAPGHNSTDYARFYSSQPGEVYKVTQYHSAYEPYVIFKKTGPPWCDERFIGYGGNKAACLFEMYLSGMSFYVLSDHFLVHQSHLYEEAARRQERKSNRKIYQDFKEEACLRYLKSHYDYGTLNTTKGCNVQEECKKIKGVSRVAAQLLDGKLDFNL